MRPCKVCIAALATMLLATVTRGQQVPQAAQQAYDKGQYDQAISILKGVAEREPNNPGIQVLLTKSYLEAQKYDEAVKSGEKCVAIDAKSSLCHQVLGEAYGQKADHSSALSAYGLARKTQKELETATQLDEHNVDATQALIDYDCTAPGMVGGGEEKAQPLIQKLMKLDAAEGHYAAGVCRNDKKDPNGAGVEFTKALESRLKSRDRLFDIGQFFMNRGQGDNVLRVATEGEALEPKDPRSKYYRAVGWILKSENQPDTAKLLNEYLQEAPVRSSYPSPAYAHYWLGRFYEMQKNTGKAKDEYREALKSDGHFKKAQDALKQIEGK